MFDHVDLLAASVETKCHHICMCSQVLIGGKGQYFVPVGLLQYRIEIIDDNFFETMRAFYREHSVIAKNSIDVI